MCERKEEEEDSVVGKEEEEQKVQTCNGMMVECKYNDIKRSDSKRKDNTAMIGIRWIMNQYKVLNYGASCNIIL